MMGVIVLFSVVDLWIFPVVGAKNVGCDINEGRCAGLLLTSHEIHDAASLYQLPKVNVECKHSGRTLIRFMCVCLCVCRNVRMHINQVKRRSEQVEGGGSICVCVCVFTSWQDCAKMFKCSCEKSHIISNISPGPKQLHAFASPV